MTKYKERSKKLKGPDQFQTAAIGGMEWASKNKNIIIAMIAPLVLIAVGGYGYQWYTSSQISDRQDALGLVSLVNKEELDKHNDKLKEIDESIAALTAKIAAAEKTDTTKKDAKDKKDSKDKMAANADKKVAAADVEKWKKEKASKEKERDALKADHTKSLSEFKTFFDKYPSKPEGWMAGLSAANILIDKKQFKEAKEITEKIVENAKLNKFYQIQGNFLLVGLAEELGEYDQAVAHADALLSKVPVDLKPAALLAKGRALYLKGSKEEALKVINEVIKNHETSREAKTALSMKSLLR